MRACAIALAVAVALFGRPGLADEGKLTIANADFEAGGEGKVESWHWWSRTKHGSAAASADQKHGWSPSRLSAATGRVVTSPLRRPVMIMKR